MFTLNEYQITDKIYESEHSAVYRATRNQDDKTVIIKVLKEESASSGEISSYKREYEVIKGLDLEGAIKLYDFEDYRNRPVLIIEDFGGQDLKSFIMSGSLTIGELLKITIGIAGALGELHTANIIHKDINPSNILYNPETGKIKLIDFGSASILSRENPVIKNPNMLTGTLAYMSPEQTGRMNRWVDWRSDYYSFGVTLYELFTRSLPFESTDALELVHSHIARMPEPPHEINPDIPQVLSRIIMKLLLKNAEERYQSVWGIKADLQECLKQLQATGKIEPFPLALHDTPDRFQIPQKLYGREKEIETLMAAFNWVSGGRKEMMLVSGRPGIGKTSLVKEIYKPITQTKGYFISGKFDQFQRNVPYSAVVGAFKDLVGQLLTESEAELAEWRDKILEALGSNGQIIIDVITEVELIIGPQPEVPVLDPAETQNRFRYVFQSFIHVFCQKEHPLAVFLDDLQWADSASLKFLELMMTDEKTTYLFLTGAYRDTEVDPSHPLFITIDNLKKEYVEIHQIVLGGLDLESITELASDTLHDDHDTVAPLAKLLIKKTNGNPFFVNEFIKSLYSENLLTFDLQVPGWKWDLEKIKARKITDNVVDLMAGKIKKFKPETQDVLKLSAAIGNRFELERLSIVYETPLFETAACLNEAVTEGLVIPLGDAYGMSTTTEYTFSHDRVQQAAYSLIKDTEKPIVHLKIGRLLLQNTPEEKREEKIFDFVNQINLGIDYIDDPNEKLRLTELNLSAGKKAKESAAFEPSLSYFKTGIDLLPDDSWQNNYRLTLALYEEASESAYICAEFDEMEKLTSVVLQEAKSNLDKVKSYEVKIETYLVQNMLAKAIDTGLTILSELGIKFPKNPGKIHLVKSLIQTKIILFGKKIESFLYQPELKYKHALSAMNIMRRLAPPTYLSNPDLFLLVMLKNLRLTVTHGNGPKSPGSFMPYAMILCGALYDINTGYQFGQLSVNLAKKLNNRDEIGYVIFLFECFIRHWKNHVKDSLNPLLISYQLSLETGMATWSGYSQMWYAIWSYVMGQNLADLEAVMTECREATRRVNHQASYLNTGIFLQVVSNLRGKAKDPCRLEGEHFDEENTIQLHFKANERYGIHCIYLMKLKLCYLFHNYEEASLNATKAKDYEDNAISTINVPLFNLFDSLTKLALFNDSIKGKSILKKVNSNQKKMKKWAYHAPMNHQHKYHLVEAERHRVLGRDEKAMDFYDLAIAGAQENEYIQEEALANELAAKFYLSRDKNTAAKAYMLEALSCYKKWGATAKVRHLEETYGDLLAEAFQLYRAKSWDEKATFATAIKSPESRLDLASVMKASLAISGEIVLENLLDRLMKIVMENAGAQKGFLILESTGQLFIEAEGRVDPDDVKVQRSVPSEKSQELSAGIVNYVARTKESVVLDNATQEGKFTSDPYVLDKKPKSILCMTLIHQGKLTGILYLENNLTTAAFTSDRLEVLELLCSQAAISLENARLYEKQEEQSRTLEQRVTERTVELKESLETLKRTQNQLVQSGKMASLGGLVSGVAHEVNTPVGIAVTAASLLDEKTGQISKKIASGSLKRSDLENYAKVAVDSARMVLTNLRRAGDIVQSFKQVAVDQSSEEKRTFKLKNYIDDVLLSLKPKLKRTGHSTIVRCPEDLEIHSYPGAFSQILTNLVINPPVA